jgi:hypothetical protein
MISNNERLTLRFIELLVERAASNGQTVSRWARLTPAWRRVFSETIAAFLGEVGYDAISERPIHARDEEEQIRLLCDRMTACQRLIMYRQLYALGCRIDHIDQEIGKLTKSRG